MTMIAVAPAIATPSGKNRLVQLLRTLGAHAMDALGYFSGAAARRRDAIAADALQDRCHTQIVRHAALGAQEAQIRGCGCAARFDRLIVLGRNAERYDALEDGHYDTAFAEVDRGRTRVMAITATTERLLVGTSREALPCAD